MPQLGEIRSANHANKNGYNKQIWAACIDCGKERWVDLLKGQPRDKYCHSCAVKGERSYSWKGGVISGGQGYLIAKLFTNDFFYSMANKKGYFFQHRLIMAKHLGRCLHIWEIVHHKNHNSLDNRIENLELISNDKHSQITIMQSKINSLLKENKALKVENNNLKQLGVEAK